MPTQAGSYAVSEVHLAEHQSDIRRAADQLRSAIAPVATDSSPRVAALRGIVEQLDQHATELLAIATELWASDHPLVREQDEYPPRR